jgi:hypothetical protein
VRRHRAPSSRCCRRTTPPATSPRLSSVCRSGSRCRPPSPNRGCCVWACRWSSAWIPSPTAWPRVKLPPEPASRGGCNEAAPEPDNRHRREHAMATTANRNRLTAGGVVASPNPDRISATPSRRLPRHDLRHVHGDPRHPDRLRLADQDSSRSRGEQQTPPAAIEGNPATTASV